MITRKLRFAFDDKRVIEIKSKSLTSCANLFKEQYTGFQPIGKIVTIDLVLGRIYFQKKFAEDSTLTNFEKLDMFVSVLQQRSL